MVTFWSGFRRLDADIGSGGRPVGIGGQNENLVFEIGDQGASFRNGGDEEWVFADGDWFALRFGVTGGILYGGFNQHTGCTLAERASCESTWVIEIEMMSALSIRLAACTRAHFKLSDIDAGTFDGDPGAIDRLAEEVIGAHRPGYVIARPIPSFGLVVFACKVDRHFEFRQHITIDVEGDFRRFRRTRLSRVHQCAQVVGA